MRVLLFLLLLMFSFPAAAMEPGEVLNDPVLEARARDISRQLRCLVCQGESVDESSAAFAKDVRLVVRDRLKAGDSDAQVLAFLQARYGDFILLKPPLDKKTMVLWLMPLFVLGAGLVVVKGFIRRRKA